MSDYMAKLLPGAQLIRGNSESPEQAFPVSDVREKQLPQPAYIEACKGHRLYLHRPNGKRYQFGYIANVVTANGLPMPDRRVLCLTQSGELVGETRSDSSGNYRFDGLYLDEHYMLIAQDKPAFSEGAEYNAVAADFQAPTPYEPSASKSGG